MLQVYKTLDKVIYIVDVVLSVVGSIALFFIAAVTFVDVIFRYIVSYSIPGTQEMVEMAMPIVVYGAMSLAIRNNKMISVEFITDMLPSSARKAISCVMMILCAIAMGIITWKIFGRMVYYMGGTYTTAVAKIPYAPFYGFTALGSAFMAINFVLRFIKLLAELHNNHTATKAKEGKL